MTPDRGRSLRRLPATLAGVCAILAMILGVSIVAGLHDTGPLTGRVHGRFPFLGASPAPVADSSYEGSTGAGTGAGGPAGAGRSALGPGAPGGGPGATSLGPGAGPVGGSPHPGVGGTPVPGQPRLTGPCIPSVQTDSASYAKGATVSMAVVIINSTATPCNVPAGPGAPAFYVLDGSGRQVWGGCDSPDGHAVPCPPGPGTQPLAPNGVFTSSTTWNQQRPNGGSTTQVSPGTYSVGYGRVGTSYNSTITIRG